MLFYLDKELAKQGIAKCIAVSEKEISQEELEERKVCFNIQEILIYEGIDIPHKFKYNETLNNIEELIEIEEIAPRMLSEEIQEVESDFDEEVEVDPEKQYFYLDKAYADKFHKSQVIAVFPKPLKNPNQYFQKEVYSHFGKDIPFYISIDEGNIIREATEYEKYQRGQRKLSENEVIFKENIIILEPGQYIDEEKQELITVPCPPKYLVNDWDKENHIWIDLTTDYDRVQAQYREYEGMDTPSTIKEMELQDPALSEEYVTMMIELRTLMYSLQEQKQVRARTIALVEKEIDIPHASKALETFKNKFNSK
ncbi:hypothetical protein [Fusobacterium mortiferum]|uniref:Uncharacterized protein n=1 Tax=Fusobacterium mortiferum ATCC 9817 TaxID=469616 RepID=A0ABN5JAN1_FUSMR|nr:hypothetical protein [Fusobacterium mortiferum]AVQ18742.1 hypothetical protein C4N19_06415 [Fusobacterium mortiferum ATCC 9817]AVQ19183.1 hypothetical protein C4N19_08775 [Fusobacterium mortiferum ATCC 9817]EEO36961.1 hypothetical protein FMAG_02523 [Fusobacterium mortiferum ATCC 9817]